MDVLNIPLVEKLGIQRSENGYLQLPFSETVHNHLKTVFASAQFTLAETASGDYLQTQFPELVGKVVPILRDAQVKFRKPGLQTLLAYPSISEQALTKFREQFANKGRASISVHVDLKDQDDTLTLSGDYSWFVQAIE